MVRINKCNILLEYYKVTKYTTNFVFTHFICTNMSIRSRKILLEYTP